MTELTLSETITVADAPGIPGLVFRRLRRPDDFAPLAELERRAALADEIDHFPTPEDLANDYAHLVNANLDEDVVIVEHAGQVIGWQQTNWRSTADGERWYMLRGNIVPEWRRRGLGRVLLRHGERRQAEVAAQHPEAQRVRRAFTPDTRPGKMALLEQAGYTVDRHFYDMLRDDLDNLPEAPLPDGLEIRPVVPEQLRTIWLASEEAFRDHWGNVAESEEDFARRLADPDFNPGLWQVAWDIATGEVAGVSINFIPSSNAALGVQRGWVTDLSVRRPWRKRGLGRALLVGSLRVLREHGQTQARLDVDAANISGALRLYEGVGFRPIRHMLAYVKPF